MAEKKDDETLPPSKAQSIAPIPETQAPKSSPKSSPATDATLAAGSVTAPSTRSTIATSSAALPLVPREHYTIISEYARGGLGRILRARDVRTGRPVAIKEMLHGTPDAAMRFVREAMVTANLQHPAIVPVYEVGRWPSGEPFYAMKFVVGKSLEDVAAAAKTHAERMAILPHVIATAEALAYAHGEQIIHRDLKPANVLTGAYGETVVVDWGLAKRLGESDKDDPTVPAAGPQQEQGDGKTMIGSVMGTPAYMPPEQALGALVDERADVYALGAILYQVLSGVTPYADAPGAQRSTADQILTRVISEPPLPLAEAAPETPVDLIAIVDKAMAREPEARYRTAKDLAEDLRRFQTGQLVSAHKYSWQEVATRWIRRNRAAVTVGAVLVLALVVGGVISVQRILRERDSARAGRAEAQRQEENAVRQRAAAEAAQLTARDKLAELLEEQGRQELLAKHPARAIVYLTQAYLQGRDLPDLRYLLARAAPALDAPPPSSDGHEQAIVAAAFSRDGAHVVTASYDKTAKVWDAASGRHVATLRGHGSKVLSARFSPDGARVATGSQDETARLWNATTGALEQTLTGHGKRVRRAEWSPDGAQVATGGDDGTARLWDARTGATVHTLAHGGAVASLAWNRQGTRVATGGEDFLAKVWDVRSGALLATLAGHTNAVLSIEWSPDGTRLVTTGFDKSVRVWNAATGAELARMEHKDWTYSASFSEDGTRVVSGSYDRTAKVWNARTGALQASLEGHSAYVRTARFSPDGQVVVTSSDDRTARLWDARTGRIVGILVGHTGTVQLAAFSIDGARVLTAGDDHTARVWDAHKAQLVATCDGQAVSDDTKQRTIRRAAGLVHSLGDAHAAGLVWADFSPDGSLLVTGAYDNTAWIWDGRTGAKLRQLKGHTGAVHRAFFSPDGTRVLTKGSSDGTARVWDAATGAELLRLASEGGGENLQARWSTDGARIITAGAGGAAIWDARTGAKLLALPNGGADGHTDWVGYAELSIDGTRAITSSKDRTAKIWDAATGKLLHTLSGHRLPLAYAKFSPDGERVVITSHDETASLWNAHSGRKIAVMDQHTDDLWYGEFSPDGTRIVTCSSDKTSKIWDGHSGKLLASLDGHTFWVTWCVFSPDSNLVLTAGEEGAAKGWSARTGKLLFSYDLHTDWLGSIVVSADGTRVITSGGDKTAKVWDMSYEARSAAELERLVAERVPWTLDDSRLIPRQVK